ncbi:MAG: nif-specific transcriptional activator NifA [Gammaproteobacteria bacterium]
MTLVDPRGKSGDHHYLSLLESELECLYTVGQACTRSSSFHETISEVIRAINESGSMRHGMISLVDEENDEILVTALNGNGSAERPIRLKAAEGIVGAILESGAPRVISRISAEDRFLNRVGVYDLDMPLIGVPIPLDDKPAGVLAAQPIAAISELEKHRRFLEMVASFLGQRLLLTRKVEEEQHASKTEDFSQRRKIRGEHSFANLIGETRSMRMVFDLVRQVAKWNTTVLVRGESGTGKELIANAIHYNSPRANGPFVKLNCAALPDTLLESELFGHEKGAFTGAVNQRKGRFEQADGGTIFLDEIGEISSAFQAKLLRVLQEGEFERVGGFKTQKVDIRVVAATNKNLEFEVQQGGFREDLYYRLNVMPIHIPPLRERVADIPGLCRHLVRKIGRIQGRELSIDERAINQLIQYAWPGNVRELENCLERAAIMSEGGHIERVATGFGPPGDPQPSAPYSFSSNPVKAIDLNDPDLEERDRIIAALEQAGWVQAKAARLLGMTPRQIGYRIQTLNIKMREF